MLRNSASLLSLPVLAAATLGLCSCGSSSHSAPTPAAVHLNFSGKAFGGEQPITGSVIHLEAVNTSTNAGPSTDLLTTTITTSDGSGIKNANANAGNNYNQLPAGYFTFDGAFTCPSANTEVYFAAVGGDPGEFGHSNTLQNSLAAIGPCGNLSSSTYLVINEVTTVATVAALHSYMTAWDHVGSTVADSSALATAFNQVNVYANISTGTAPGTVPPGYTASEYDLRALANAVQTCTNSTGSAAVGQPCNTFFGYAQGAAAAMPSDTVAALVDINTTPTNNVANIYKLANATGSFQPTCNSALNPTCAAPADLSLPIYELPATPTFYPAGGTYNGIESVSIWDSSAAIIYYTTDGSTPTERSTRYDAFNGPITVSTTETLKAIGVAENNIMSPVGSASYVITSGLTALPAGVPSVLAPSAVTYGNSATPITVTVNASSAISGSLATLGTTHDLGGTFSPNSCVIASSGSCSVTYTPSATLMPGTYPYLTATTTPFGRYASSSGTGNLVVNWNGATQNGIWDYGDYIISDGSPYSAPIQASDGNFYGVTPSGGTDTSDCPGEGYSAGCGLLYEISVHGTYGTSGFSSAFTILHNFNNGSAHLDGTAPYASLMVGADGNLYGVATGGGTNKSGTIFRYTPGSSTDSFVKLHDFTTAEGSYFITPLIQGSDGNFYGVAPNGGASLGGTAFQVVVSGNTATVNLLHSFSITLLGDGYQPMGPLVQASDGSIYGVTMKSSLAGAASEDYDGLIFQLTSSNPSAITPSNTTYTIKQFLRDSVSGMTPDIGLTAGADGKLYGVTSIGLPMNPSGSVFRYDFTTNSLTGLYNYKSTDPLNTRGALLLAGDGNFYTQSYNGGSNSLGGFYRIATDGTSSGTTVTMITNPPAGAQNGPNDVGKNPSYGVVQGADGYFYGTAAFGYGGYGVFWQDAITPAVPKVIQVSVPTSVERGAGFQLAYKVVNATSMSAAVCSASNSAGDTIWKGPLTGSTSSQSVNLVAPSTAGTYTYGLNCGGNEFGVATLVVN